MSEALIKIGRAWEFGRRIPPQKIVRRFILSLSRRISDAKGPRLLLAPAASLHVVLPAPVFQARNDEAVMAEDDGLRFDFLGRSILFGGGQINWAGPGAGSAHQLWRMNLHYMEYLEPLPDNLFQRLVQGWLDAHDRIQPGAWRDSWNSYALSIRVVVWLQQLANRQATLPDTLVSRMSESIARQMAFLERNLETDIGGNHLVKNIKALLWAGACFDGVAAQRWLALGKRLLARELAVQVLSDGIHYERSPSYHDQVFADLLECRAVLPDPMPALDEALEHMAQAAADLSHPDGLVAQFNDAGLHMAYTPAECLDVHVAQGGTRPVPQRCFAYPDAGYFGFRSERLYIVADCGAICPADLPAHAHGDVLSFELSVDGQRVIVDQGVYEYIPGDKRNQSRAAQAHNTVWAKGSDMAGFWGAFRCGRRPQITNRTWSPSTTGFTLAGAHDGYRKAPGGPVAHRRFDVAGTEVTITDRLSGKQPLPAFSGFLLHPDISVERQDAHTVHLKMAHGPVLQMNSTVPLADEAAVWWPDMGCERPTLRLVAEHQTPGAEARIRLALMQAT